MERAEHQYLLRTLGRNAARTVAVQRRGVFFGCDEHRICSCTSRPVTARFGCGSSALIHYYYDKATRAAKTIIISLRVGWPCRKRKRCPYRLRPARTSSRSSSSTGVGSTSYRVSHQAAVYGIRTRRGRACTHLPPRMHHGMKPSAFTHRLLAPNSL